MPPAPGSTPSLASGRPSLASGVATRMSHARASSRPPPIATPCTAAITGNALVAMTSRASVKPWMKFSNSPRSLKPRISSMSAPAENTRPAPCTTTARTDGSSSNWRTAAAISVYVFVPIGLSRSAPSSRIQPTESWHRLVISVVIALQGGLERDVAEARCALLPVCGKAFPNLGSAKADELQAK